MNRFAIASMLGLSLSFALSAPAAAGSFNDRGEDWITAAPAGSQAPRETVTATASGFNQRGVDYTATAPAGSYEPRPPVRATLEGFNQRSQY